MITLENSLKRLVRLKNSNSISRKVSERSPAVVISPSKITLSVRPMPLDRIAHHQDEPRLGNSRWVNLIRHGEIPQ